MGMAAAFVDSMVDEMGDDGSFPDVVPFQRFGNRPADLSWSAAFFSTLTSLWHEAGDLDSAQKHWGAVKTHMGNLQAQYGKAGALNKLPEPYGDWCPPPATKGKGKGVRPSHGFAAAFSMVRAIQQAADIGAALGGDAAEDAKTYTQLAATLREEFHSDFYNASKKQYDNGDMITSVLPLALGAVPMDLHDSGHGDVALAMLKKREYPSYGYMYFNDLEPAKECMWELPDAPYQGTGMNSRNHHMFSSVGHYLMTRVAGLSHDPTERQFHAVVGSEPTSTATLRTAKGEAEFSWTRSAAVLEVKVVVPEGLQATLHVPVADGLLQADSVRVKSEEVIRHRQKFNMMVLETGTHRFTTSAMAYV